MDIEKLEKEFSDNSIKLFHKLNEDIASCKATLFSKSKEYTPSYDVFENFRIATEILNMKSNNVKWEFSDQSSVYNFALKHFVSILTLIRDYEETGIKPTQSVLNEKIGDAQNYLFLIKAMFSE